MTNIKHVFLFLLFDRTQPSILSYNVKNVNLEFGVRNRITDGKKNTQTDETQTAERK